MDGKQSTANHCINAFLTAYIALCFIAGFILLDLSGALEALGIPISASAAETSNNVTLSYTPAFNTQYFVSVPTGLTMNSDGSATSLDINIASWSDFPVNRQLYCNLAGVTDLTNGEETIGLTIKYGDTIVEAGDEIDRFQPSAVSSDTKADFVVLTVQPAAKPTQSGTYSGNLSFTIGLVEE